MASHDDTFRIDKKKALITAGLALALAVGAVALIGQAADWHRIVRGLEQANKYWFPLCLGGEILAYAGYVAAYRDVARVDGGPRLSLWTATRIVAVGFGAFVAGSSAGTLGLDFWALHRSGEQPHRAARRVLALNTLEWGFLASFAALAAVATLAGRGSGAPLGMELGWLVVVPACIFAALWVSSPDRADRFSSLPDSEASLHRHPRTWLPWLARVARAGLADAIGGVALVRYLLSHPRRYWSAVLGYPLYWAGDILTLYAALRAFDVHIAPAPLVLAYTTAYVVTSLPLPAGGAGGVEAGLAFTLTTVGIPLAPALLATLVYRVFTLWLPIIPALLFLPQLKHLAEELPHVEHERQLAAKPARVGID